MNEGEINNQDVAEDAEPSGDEQVEVTPDAPTETTSPDAPPLADDPTPTSDPAVPGEAPVQVEGPGVPDDSSASEQQSSPEDAE